MCPFAEDLLHFATDAQDTVVFDPFFTQMPKFFGKLTLHFASVIDADNKPYLVCSLLPFVNIVHLNVHFPGLSFDELMKVKHPTAWVEFEKDLINEDELCARFFADGRTFDRIALLQTMVRIFCGLWIPGLTCLLSTAVDSSTLGRPSKPSTAAHPFGQVPLGGCHCPCHLSLFLPFWEEGSCLDFSLVCYLFASVWPTVCMPCFIHTATCRWNRTASWTAWKPCWRDSK